MNPVFVALNSIFIGRIIAAAAAGIFGILAFVAMLRGKADNATTWGRVLGFFAGSFLVLGLANMLLGGSGFGEQFATLIDNFASGRLDEFYPLPTLPPPPSGGSYVPSPVFALLFIKQNFNLPVISRRWKWRK